MVSRKIKGSYAGAAEDLRKAAVRRARMPEASRGLEMTVKEAAAYLRISTGTLRGWLCKQQIPAYKFFGKVRLFSAELDKWKSAQMVEK